MREAIKDMTTRLSAIYEPGEAAAITELVMEYLTGVSKKDRGQVKDVSFNTEQREKVEKIIARLLTHEPVQYVLNESWFCGLKLYVDKNVLIPRPETEELVEWIIDNCRFPLDQLRILDIGSGSGCIPIALKRRLRKADVWGCDISATALDIARQNATTLGTEVNFIELDFLDHSNWEKLPSFDLIVSNPPYIAKSERLSMQRNVVVYEPPTALFVPDADPLVFYRAIATFGHEKQNTDGSIYLEIHEDLGNAVTSLFVTNGYKVTLKKDMQGKDRMIKAIHK
jgi:release factor glutamine methyltransferase